MNILVSERFGKNIRLCLPTGLVINSVSAHLIAQMLKKENGNISGRQLCILFRVIRSYKAAHPQWKLVEIHSHNGDHIVITV